MLGWQSRGGLKYGRDQVARAVQRCLCQALVWLSAAALPGTLLGTEASAADEDAAAAYKRLSLEELMNLEVTSVSRRPEPLAETASAIQVISGEDIRRSGASTLPASMRLANNLNVAQKNAHDWGISARGFNTNLANKLLVLIDGRAVYTPLFSGVFWNTQDVFLEDVDRIEVISGPGGSVWGANAVNGVISVITKSAQESQGLFVEGGVGSQERVSTAVRYGGAVGRGVHYRVWGKYIDADGEKLAGGDDAGDAWHRTAGGFRVDGSPAANSHWTFQGDLYRGDDGQVTGGEANVSGGNVLGRWRRELAGAGELSVQAYHDWARLTLPVPTLIINGLPFAPAGVFRDRLETYDIEMQHRATPHGVHHPTWGLGFRLWRDRVENAPGLGFLPEARDHRLWSGFIQDEVTLGARARLSLGTKIEHNDFTGVEIEPSARILVAIDDHRSWWAAISRAVRTPSRLDRELFQPVPPHLVLLAGSPEFESESVVALESGYRSRIGSRVSAMVAAFYNEYRDLRSTSTTPVTILPFFFANNVEGETYGLEATSTVVLSERWRLHLGYTVLLTHLGVREGEEDFNAALNETADPQQQVLVRSSADLGRAVALDVALRWVDTLRTNSGPIVGTVPSYFELDLRLAWRLSPSLELSLVGRNLLDDTHPEYGFPGPERVEIGRAVVGRVTWRR